MMGASTEIPDAPGSEVSHAASANDSANIPQPFVEPATAPADNDVVVHSLDELPLPVLLRLTEPNPDDGARRRDIEDHAILRTVLNAAARRLAVPTVFSFSMTEPKLDIAHRLFRPGSLLNLIDVRVDVPDPLVSRLLGTLRNTWGGGDGPPELPKLTLGFSNTYRFTGPVLRQLTDLPLLKTTTIWTVDNLDFSALRVPQKLPSFFARSEFLSLKGKGLWPYVRSIESSTTTRTLSIAPALDSEEGIRIDGLLSKFPRLKYLGISARFVPAELDLFPSSDSLYAFHILEDGTTLHRESLNHAIIRFSNLHMLMVGNVNLTVDHLRTLPESSILGVISVVGNDRLLRNMPYSSPYYELSPEVLSIFISRFENLRNVVLQGSTRRNYSVDRSTLNAMVQNSQRTLSFLPFWLRL